MNVEWFIVVLDPFCVLAFPSPFGSFCSLYRDLFGRVNNAFGDNSLEILLFDSISAVAYV